MRGFFQPILDRIGSDEVRESLAAELEARMGTDELRVLSEAAR